MSQNIITQAGAKRILSLANASILNTWAVGLWQNNYLPNYLTTFASLVESTFPGYARTFQSWGVGTFGQGGILTQGGRNYMCTASTPLQYIYGYFILDTVSSDLILVRRFDDGPFPIQHAGDGYAFTAQFDAVSQYLA